jgi:hypothetical protein
VKEYEDNGSRQVINILLRAVCGTDAGGRIAAVPAPK